MFKYAYIDRYTDGYNFREDSDLQRIINNYRCGDYIGVRVDEYAGSIQQASFLITDSGMYNLKVANTDCQIVRNLSKLISLHNSKYETIVSHCGMGDDWHDLESVRGVVKCAYKKSEKPYIPQIYYFVEYIQGGYKKRGVTDKKSVVTALFNDTSISITCINIKTGTDSFALISKERISIYGRSKEFIDSQWFKWFKWFMK